MRVEMNYRNLLKGGLAAAMAFTMAACSSNSGSASGSTDSQSSGNAGDAGKTAFKLGGSGPLTGGAAVYGTAVYNALKIAVDEVNAAGDVQFELDFQDDAHDQLGLALPDARVRFAVKLAHHRLDVRRRARGKVDLRRVEVRIVGVLGHG